MKLFPFQEIAVASVFAKWKSFSSIMGVSPTGSGKTVMFSAVIHRSLPARALILCHRDELVTQCVSKLAKFGVHADVDKADRHASTGLFNRFPAVVATPQTLYSNNNKRLYRWKPTDFNVLIIDELHHYVSPAFRRCVDYFRQNPDLKILGVTATADRHDKKSLARICQSVAFNIEIGNLIDEGYLVTPHAYTVKIKSLDLSGCRVVADDFNGRDLSEVMEVEETLLGVADAAVQKCGDRRKLVFTASVKQAERLAEIFNRYDPDTAAFVSGETPEIERRDILKRFAKGELRTLCNCAVLTEGFDDPGIEAVVMAKPTRSRTLFAQMLGRGMRPLEGIIHEGLPTAALRREAIAQSRKPNVLVLDFTGNCGSHRLIGPEDILSGTMSDEAISLARKRIQEKPTGANVLDELRIAESEVREKAEAARRAGLTGKAEFTLHYSDLLDAWLVDQEHWKGHKQFRLSKGQRMAILKAGRNPDDYSVDDNVAFWHKLKAASPAQRSYMRSLGIDPKICDDPLLKVWDASRLIDAKKKEKQ